MFSSPATGTSPGSSHIQPEDLPKTPTGSTSTQQTEHQPYVPPQDSVLTNDQRLSTSSMLNSRYTQGIVRPSGSKDVWKQGDESSKSSKPLPSLRLRTSPPPPVVPKSPASPTPPVSPTSPASPTPPVPPPKPPTPPVSPATALPKGEDAVVIDATWSDSKTHYEIVKMWADFQGRLSQGLSELSQDMVQNVSRVEGHH